MIEEVEVCYKTVSSEYELTAAKAAYTSPAQGQASQYSSQEETGSGALTPN